MTARARSALPTTLICRGCGASPDEESPFPFTCPNAGTGDVDHVLRRLIDTETLAFPASDTGSGEQQPFARYRNLLHSYQRARAGGLDDAQFVELVRRLDGAVARIDGHGFAATPFARSDGLSEALGFDARGGVWVKDETNNVSGSHKARHLMGVMLHLAVSESLGLFATKDRPDLAIASCGNAALAAAVVSSAAHWPLRVFVPTDADPVVLDRLQTLDADVIVCPRQEATAGDPTFLGLTRALAEGALPFTCQGNLNGLAIEGGETLAYEVASDLFEGSSPDPNHLVVQVGGGALASSCAQGLEEALAFGAISDLPRLHAVQTSGAHPLERAYRLVRDGLPANFDQADVTAAISRAVAHRSNYMWPWEQQPKSIAAGILDDETYDWAAVVEAMLSTDGRPVVVDEERLADAHALAAEAGFKADPTGSASVAGLLDLLESGIVKRDERVVVLLTGAER